MTSYSFCDIVLLGFPHTNLLAVTKRPALVIYDAGDNDILVSRITSQVQETNSDYKIANWKDSGLICESYVRLSKMATIEKRHVIRRLGALMDFEHNYIKEILRVMFNL